MWLAGWSWAGPLEDGDTAFEAGDHPTALVSWGRALVEARASEDAPRQVDLLLRMSAAQRELGAIALAGRAIDEAETLADAKNRADIAMARARLALHVGDTDAASKGFRKAYRSHRELEEPASAANAALNLGVARLRQGELDGAHDAFEAARTLYQTLGDARGEADAWTDLALVDRRRGDPRAARTRLEHALRLFDQEKAIGGAIDARINLASIASDLARPAEARRHLEDALQAARSRRDLARQAAVLTQLAALSWASGDVDRATEQLELAGTAYAEVGRRADALRTALDSAVIAPPADPGRLIALARELGDPQSEARARVLAARISLTRGEPKATQEAEKQAEKALALATRLELSEVRWQALYVLGAGARAEGDLERASKHLEEAVALLDTELRLRPHDDADAFRAGHEPVYQALAEVHLARGEPLAALAAAERLARSELPLADAAAPASNLAQREADLQRKLGAEVAQFGDSERAQALRQRLADVRVQFAAEVDRLRTDVGDLDARVRVAPEDLEALQGELPEGVAVLQPILLDDRLVLLVFTRESLRAVSVEVGAAEVEGTLNKLTRALRAGLRDRNILDPLADKLGAWFWAPIQAELEAADTLVVSTAGDLRQLPFGLVRHDGRYLIEEAAVVAITHVGSLRGSASPLRVEGRSLLLVGNPDGTLPGAAAEVEALADRFSGSTVLIGEDATRAALLARMEGRTAVHLATHGRIDPDRPAHSYLVLAPDDSGETRLGYREIPGLAPFLGGARLVVLSACESGRPVEARGGAGVVSIQGLAAQFRRAGVETLVASLWKVDDAGTKALMEAFYAELAEGHDAGTALANAQRSLLDDPTHGTPWVWAAFVVAGDWR